MFDTKVWLWVTWGSEPRIAVLVRARSHFYPSPSVQAVSCCIVSSRYLATASEQAVGVVIYRVCESARLL
jgi:hypothetical protein